MEKDGHAGKNGRKTFPDDFIHPHNQNSGSDWDGSARLSPKSRLFGGPFYPIDFPGTAGKILTACGRGAFAPKKTGPAFAMLFYSSS